MGSLGLNWIDLFIKNIIPYHRRNYSIYHRIQLWKKLNKCEKIKSHSHRQEPSSMVKKLDTGNTRFIINNILEGKYKMKEPVILQQLKGRGICNSSAFADKGKKITKNSNAR